MYVGVKMLLKDSPIKDLGSCTIKCSKEYKNNQSSHTQCINDCREL